MWYSIKSIKKPETLTEAVSLQNDGQVYFSGGSYLLAVKDPNMHTIIDINNLVGDGVTAGMDGVHIDAGATLQTFLDTVESLNPECRLIKGIKFSCPSKQIRNQRTFGGEVGEGRPNSEIMVFLHAVNAKLTIYRDEEKCVQIRDWDGSGIITKISYFPNQIDGIELERFSVLDSAPAIAIVCGIKRKNNYEFSIGGTANDIQTFKVNVSDWSKESGENMAKKAVNKFRADSFGSLDYKEKLITVAIKRVGDTL